MPPARAQKQPPQRTCVSCRSTSGKRDLVRIVRSADGSVDVDPTGKKPGRGAYLCLRVDCWQAALKKDRLATALRTKLTSADRQRLQQFAESLGEQTVVS